MKLILLFSFATLLVWSCQKDLKPVTDDYHEKVRKGLQESLHITDFKALDFSKAGRSSVDSAGLYFLRIPFKGKKGNEDFVWVKTNKTGQIEKGRIIHLEGKITESNRLNVKVLSWNGKIAYHSLDRRKTFESPVENGYITALHQLNRLRTTSHAPEENVLPEIIITYTRSSGANGYSWSPWFMLQIPPWDGSGSGGGYYSDFSDGGGYTGGGGGGSSIPKPVIQVDLETQDEQDPIDIEKFINCFTAIPDAGASCSIEIFADIPVDSDPNKIFNFTSRSPGHTFLNIRKSNGSKSVSQNIGFYPKLGWKSILTTAPIDGKFVNNSQHEFNCGFKLTITPAQLQAAINEMLRSKHYKYDIDNYNCTDWALDVFNAAGGNLQIPLYDIPGNTMSMGSRMPNGIYHKLQQMKTNSDPRSAGITIGIVKGFAGNSTGTCN